RGNASKDVEANTNRPPEGSALPCELGQEHCGREADRYGGDKSDNEQRERRYEDRADAAGQPCVARRLDEEAERELARSVPCHGADQPRETCHDEQGRCPDHTGSKDLVDSAAAGLVDTKRTSNDVSHGVAPSSDGPPAARAPSSARAGPTR